MSKELDFLKDLKELLKKHDVTIECNCASYSLYADFGSREMPFCGEIGVKVIEQMEEE